MLTTTVLGLAFVSTEFQSKGLWFVAAGTTVLLQRVGPTRLGRWSEGTTARVPAVGGTRI